MVLHKFLTTIPILFLAACNNASTSHSYSTQNTEPVNSEAQIASAHTTGEQYIVVGQPSYPPFSIRGEKGEMIGLDIDLLNAIAQREGFALRFIPHEMTGLLDTVNNGQADIVATGINVTSEREEKYTFSQPYLEGSWVVLLNKNKTQYRSLTDLQGKTVAAQQDSLAEKQLLASGITDKIETVKTVHLGVNAVNMGTAEGVYDVDSVLNTYFLQSGSEYYTLVDEKSGKVTFSWVMKKGNTELKAKLDKGLEDIKADGTYDKIIKKWYPMK